VILSLVLVVISVAVVQQVSLVSSLNPTSGLIFSQAPVIEWNKQSAQGVNKDRWSQTYVAKAPSPSPTRAAPPQLSSPPLRHRGLQSDPALASRVTEHIASATNSTSRPSSPLKHSTLSEDAILSAPNVVLSPYSSSELSKVYGSVLQPKETLESFHCHVCSEQFTPDATIYPHPKDTSGEHYLCRSCFSQNGGSRGNCVQCTRPVLLLKSEGGFVEKTGQVWHKKCFICSGCGKNIGDNPTVDLLGRPSCAECFDTCLTRRDSPGKFKTPITKGDVDDFGQLKRTSISTPPKARKGSSTIEELEQVLGIRRSQSAIDTNHDRTVPPDVASAPLPSASTLSSPSLPIFDDSSKHSTSTSELDAVSPSRLSSTPSRPASKIPTKVTPEAIEAVKRRFLKPTGSPSENNVQVQVTPIRDRYLAGDTLQTPTKSSVRYSDFRLLRHKGSVSSIRTDRDSMLSLSSAVSTPSLTSDISDTATASSGPSSPPSLNGEQEESASFLSSSPTSGLSALSGFSDTRNHDLGSETYTKQTISNSVNTQPLSNARCAKCSLPLFDVAHGGRYVSVPEPSSTGSLPRRYHADCFRCRICNGLFEEKETGRAVFVRGVRGACHLDVSIQLLLQCRNCTEPH
jgi:formylmethanofuran dehydrogenase subunit E